MTRNKPIRHVVSSHKREGKPVRSYIRGSGERKLRRTFRTPDYLSERPDVHDLKSGQTIIYKGVPITLGKIVGEGRFVSGTDHITVNSVSVNGKPVFNKKDYYVWDDPDFPSETDVNKAIKDADEAGEKMPMDAWPDYLDYKEGTYKFKIQNFMVYGDSRSLSVDALPIAPLGRLSIEDLQDENGSPIWERLKK